ncbi:MAG: hypothetical protein F6K54_26450 [Okeania sp. SIO3B5]|uniref:DUF6603 domain-containing protein n=1 Tax=Okeania sp. SIO3B5 TaxID=2607811 RepID=UPI0013FFBA22|nr:DUF6603 domain-containing protein [Okeania sp. SIO3B5]NEO56313.1 hypothetical protein [Okeania sp. SIO3B5]
MSISDITNPDDVTVEVVAGLTTMEDFINLIIDAFGISEDDVNLTAIDIFTLTEATVEIDQQKGNYDFTVGVTIDINQDDEGNATKELSGSLKIDMKYTGIDKYTGEYGGSLSIPLSDGTNLIFDLYYQTKNEPSGDDVKLVVGQLNIQEEQDIGNVNLANLVGEICPGLESLFPEELVDAFNLQENVLLGIYSTINNQGILRKKMLFSIGFNANIQFSRIPLVGDFLPQEMYSSQFAFEFLVSLQKYTQKELRILNGLLEELNTPLKIKPPSTTINELDRGASIIAYFDILGYIKAWLLNLKRTKSSGSGSTGGGSSGSGSGTGGRSANITVQTEKSSNKLDRGSSIIAYFNIFKIWGCIKAWLLNLKRNISQGSGSTDSDSGTASKSANITAQTEKSSLVTSSTTTTPTSSDDNLITLADNGVWLEIQKSFGPIRFEKVGLVYKKGQMHLTPQFIIQDSSLLLSLNALSISSPLTDFNPEFNLDGFGLQVICRGLEISGAFLAKEGSDYDEYLGTATVGFTKGKGGKSALSLSAIGGYANYTDSGEFALFIYLAGDFPLGGPPFFFVTGLSGGLGYNYDLIVPPLEDLDEFPFVYQAMEGPDPIDPSNTEAIVTEQLELLDKYIPPLKGTGWGAVGLDFTCFKIIDCFGLVTFAISQSDFELCLIGIGLLQLPTTLGRFEPIAQAEVALEARFAPMDGVLMVRGQLTPNSYIFSRNCVLTGGFAYGLWFSGERAGDFIFSQGGYHPRFQRPPHYPDVPHIGMTWQIDHHAFTTAQIYYSLCGHGIMAGGLFAIAYKAGSVWASFDAGADFLLGWAPYHYDIDLHTHVCAGIGTVSVGLGIGIHFWGPDFGCKFKIRILVVPITIKIGDQSSIYPLPISWKEFEETFLPEPENVCSITNINGLLKQIVVGEGANEKEVWVINPKSFEMSTDSLVPSKQVWAGDDPKDFGTNTAFGINSMGITKDGLKTTHKVTIVKDLAGDNQENVEYKFTFEAIPKLASTATWGIPRMSGGHVKPPEVNAAQFIENVFYGFRITPAEPPKPGKTHEIGVEHLLYDTVLIDDRYIWENVEPFVPNSAYNTDEEKLQRIEQTLANNSQRDSILQSLGYDLTEVDIEDSEAIADGFVFAPLVT